jgi:hypothetical protein
VPPLVANQVEGPFSCCDGPMLGLTHKSSLMTRLRTVHVRKNRGLDRWLLNVESKSQFDGVELCELIGGC